MASVLIIGGGLAGLFTALKLSPLPSTVISPVPLGEGASSAWAQGGIAAAIGPGDSVDQHVADTLAAGAGLCDEAMVRLMAARRMIGSPICWPMACRSTVISKVISSNPGKLPIRPTASCASGATWRVPPSWKPWSQRSAGRRQSASLRGRGARSGNIA